ncbi:hypothetical protein AKO1_004763 [Acrasis kona]|uniref:Uncharacterized protein n=1 Tax=Acrasis kona TaxID=1008807 RepID=A0AAW2Z4K6_9EUKA
MGIQGRLNYFFFFLLIILAISAITKPWEQNYDVFKEWSTTPELDFTFHSTKNCSKCTREDFQCCGKGTKFCLGSAYKCSKITKQTCSSKYCIQLFQKDNVELCSLIEKRYHYCEDQPCNEEATCEDGSDALYAHTKPIPLFSQTTTGFLNLIFVVITSITLIMIYYMRNEYPLSSRNIWSMMIEVTCCYMTIRTFLEKHTTPCYATAQILVFSSCYIYFGKVLKLGHSVIITKEEELKVKAFDDLHKELEQRFEVQNTFYEARLKEQLRWIRRLSNLRSAITFFNVFTCCILCICYAVYDPKMFVEQPCDNPMSSVLICVYFCAFCLICCLVFFCLGAKYRDAVNVYGRDFFIDSMSYLGLSAVVIVVSILSTTSDIDITRVGHYSEYWFRPNLMPKCMLINYSIIFLTTCTTPVFQFYSAFRSQERDVTATNFALHGGLSLKLLNTYSSTEHLSHYVMLWQLIESFTHNHPYLSSDKLKNLTSYIHLVFFSESYAVRSDLGCIGHKKVALVDLNLSFLKRIQLEIVERHIVSMYSRMMLQSTFAEQIEVLICNGALPRYYNRSHQGYQLINGHASVIPNMQHQSSQEEPIPL